MDTTEQITLTGFELRADQEHAPLSVQIDNELYSLGTIRKPSRTPRRDTRYGCLIPIETVSPGRQKLIVDAYEQKKLVWLVIGETSIPVYIDSFPMPGISAGCGTVFKTAPDTFGFSVQTSESKVLV